jgi:hypothetical protein
VPGLAANGRTLAETTMPRSDQPRARPAEGASERPPRRQAGVLAGGPGRDSQAPLVVPDDQAFARVIAALDSAVDDESLRRADLERLTTGAASMVLALERERLRAKRRGTAALLDAAREPGAAQEASSLRRRELELTGKIRELRRRIALARHRSTR